MSTGKITLKSPRYRVVLGDVDDPDTWTELEVQAITPDLTRAEEVFARRKWGRPGDSAIKVTVLSAYFALLRSGLIERGTSWEDFEGSYLEVGEVGVDEVGPTLPDHEAG
jgi:hypothetical protein